MRNLLTGVLGIAVLLAMLAMLAPEPASAAKATGPQALLDRSGASQQIAQIPKIMAAQMAAEQGALPSEQREAVQQALLEAFNGEGLLASVQAEMAARYQEEHAVIVLQWLDSPLGKRFTELEVAGSTTDSVEQMRAYVEGWAANPPPKPRTNLMLRLDEAARITEAGIERYLASMGAIMGGMTELAPPDKRASPDELKRMLDTLRNQIEQPYLNQTIVALMWIYRPVSDEDVERYIEFYESAAGQWYNGAMAAALQRAMIDAGARFSLKLRALGEQSRRQT